MPARRTTGVPKTIEALRHEEAKRRNIPSAEYESLLDVASESPVQVAYERRNRATMFHHRVQQHGVFKVGL